MKAKALLTGLIAASSIGFATQASAQDLLPKDNGIRGYHQSPRYRPSESHPFRTVGYILHPVGWVLRETIYRPWSAFAGSDAMTRSVFGFREPFDYRHTDCFSSDASVPNCWELPPYSKIGGNPGLLVSGDGIEEVEETETEEVQQAEQQVFFPDVNFDFDKGELNDLGKGRVRQISQLLASVPSLSITIEGHTDYIGQDEYNQSLGMKRAKSVQSELVELGIDPARISSISYGETRPIFAEEEDWARAVNRRVQFSVGADGSEEMVEIASEEVIEGTEETVETVN